MKRPGSEWEPLREATTIRGGSPELVRQRLEAGARWWVNHLYQVEAMPGAGGSMLLSIKPRDGSARHDWREFQRIKNELCGLEREAVELYPAESRLVDSANQFWLFVLPPGDRVAFGFALRELSESMPFEGSTQRRWAHGDRPPDCDPDAILGPPNPFTFPPDGRP